VAFFLLEIGNFNSGPSIGQKAISSPLEKKFDTPAKRQYLSLKFLFLFVFNFGPFAFILPV
jgi:hypothetical protein